MVAGLAVGALGILVFALLDEHATYALAFPGYVLFGAGYGAAVPAISSVAMGAIEVEHAGVASGVLNTARQVGAAVGLPALSALGLAALARAVERPGRLRARHARRARRRRRAGAGRSAADGAVRAAARLPRCCRGESGCQTG